MLWERYEAIVERCWESVTPVFNSDKFLSKFWCWRASIKGLLSLPLEYVSGSRKNEVGG